MGPTSGRADRALRVAPAALLAAIVLIASGAPAAAEDAATPGPAAAHIMWPAVAAPAIRQPGAFRFDPSTDPRERQGYIDVLFLPKLDTRVRRLGAGDLVVFPGQRLDEQIFYETLNERAYAGVEHAAGRALREYVLEHTTFGQVITDLGDRVASRRLHALSGKSLGVDVTIAHMAPQLVLKPHLGEGRLRFTMGASGLGVRYRNEHLLGGTRVGARFDPLDRSYTLSCLVGF